MEGARRAQITKELSLFWRLEEGRGFGSSQEQWFGQEALLLEENTTPWQKHCKHTQGCSLGADFQHFEWWWQDLAQRVVQLCVVCAHPIPKAASDPTACVRGARSSVLLGVILQPLE